MVTHDSQSKFAKVQLALQVPHEGKFSRVWAEHEASELLLPDDDVDVMLLVLRIAHL